MATTLVNQQNNRLVILILRIATFCVFFGRAWQHLLWDAPYRSLFWDQALMEPIVTSLSNLSWKAYATSPNTDFLIQSLIKFNGLVYLICAIVALVITKNHKKLAKVLWVGTALLVFLSLLYYKAKFYKIGQFIEYSCQMSAPIFLYVTLFYQVQKRKLNFALKVAIALTFIGHGFYAIGWYTRPGHFVDMAMNSLHFIKIPINQDQTIQLLYWAGVLDMVVAIGIFLPKKWALPFLVWAFIWGGLTTFARVVSYMYVDPSFHTFLQWMPQTIMRMPHLLIPLVSIALTLGWHSIRYRKNEIVPVQLNPIVTK